MREDIKRKNNLELTVHPRCLLVIVVDWVITFLKSLIHFMITPMSSAMLLCLELKKKLDAISKLPNKLSLMTTVLIFICHILLIHNTVLVFSNFYSGSVQFHQSLARPWTWTGSYFFCVNNIQWPRYDNILSLYITEYFLTS